jgi:hypothetical protein
MGKKKTRKSMKSKGERRSVVGGVRAARASVDPITKEMNLLACWRAGKNPWVTIKNPDGSTNRPFIKVKANSLYGNPKFATSGLFKAKGEE